MDVLAQVSEHFFLSPSLALHHQKCMISFLFVFVYLLSACVSDAGWRYFILSSSVTE